MRADVTLWHVPVIILSNKMLSMEDVKPIEGHTRVTLQSKGIWSENETVAALNRALFGTDGLPAHTGALVKQAIAYLHQNYTRPVSRWEIAEAVDVSEDYLSCVFEPFPMGVSQSVPCTSIQASVDGHKRYDWLHCAAGRLQRSGIFQPCIS